nr:SNF2-related protein [Planktothrix agardhii]
MYDFQKKGALSLIRMLQKYDGAILADAVGLGKTWSALTVIKFFQMQGREVILLCPKKLESNWRRYKEDQESKFESDKLKFFIRFHTDMNSDRLNSYNDRADKLFCDDKPKLIVIDESHNLRNDKSQRYKFLIEQILQKNQDIKVLLISATPINNSLNDARNQFKLMVQGNVHGYETKLGIKNFDHQYQVFDLIYINKSGNLILNNQNELDFLPALRAFFAELQVPINALTDAPIPAREILKNSYKDRESFRLIDDVYFLGIVDDGAFRGRQEKTLDAVQKIEQDYDGVVMFGVTLNRREGGLLPRRSQLAEISRAFNREFCYTPVVVVFKYADADNKYLAFANTERSKYKRNQEGEKAGKVTLLRDVSISNIHATHEKIIFGDKNFKGLKIDASKINTFKKLYDYWQTVFSLQVLNDQFYGDLQDWFYYASQHIKLPFRPDYVPEKENIKNFLVRLLARTMFCWFIKEKGLIKPEILELRDWEGRVYPLVKDFEDENFLESNSYYRGVL